MVYLLELCIMDLNYSSPHKMKNNSSGSALASKMGLGPSMLDLSFFNLSMVEGKKSSMEVTIELANSRILLWDLKFIVRCLITGIYKE